MRVITISILYKNIYELEKILEADIENMQGFLVLVYVIRFEILLTACAFDIGLEFILKRPKTKRVELFV